MLPMKCRYRTPACYAALLFACAGWSLAGYLWLQSASPGTIVLERKFAPEQAPGVPIAAVFEEETAALVEAGAAVAFCLLDEQGRTIYASPLAETALSPASALKTLTTGAALAQLGPDFRFETRLDGTNKPDQGGRLDGDLILVGGGDPTLTLEDIDQLVAGLSGVGVVTGRVRVDASIFPQNPVNDHWNWGDIGNAYGAGAFGLNIGWNRMIVRFQSAREPGGPAEFIGSDPAPEGYDWHNHVTTGPPGSGDGVVVFAEPYGRRITLRGTIPAGAAGFSVRAALPDPPAFAEDYLRQKLRERDIEILGEDPPATSNPETLVVHPSAPLGEIIDHLHRVSDNLEAQALFLMLGRASGTDPANAVRAHWEKQGVSFAGLRLLDGSGLARANAIRPIDLARVNHAARHGLHGDRFWESLNASMEGRTRAKAGAMSGVRSDVGFITLPDGREYTFALMANAVPSEADFWAIRHRLLAAVE
jgi:serine-type D-Ala-D-Ala carboxypeptidase/endopeptidase (penicillin-binding protein 4)